MVPGGPECLRLIYTRLSDVHAGAECGDDCGAGEAKPKHVTFAVSLTSASIGNHILLPKQYYLANHPSKATCFVHHETPTT